MELLIVAIAVICVVVIVIIAVVAPTQPANHPARREAIRTRQEAIGEEARHFFADASKALCLPPVQTHIVLAPGEVAIRQESVQLHESRAVRLYGGVGTRIGKIYLGGGTSSSYQTIKPIDTGTLLLTTERLVFDGGKENRIVKAKEILSVQPSEDAIEVSTSRRQKSQVYTVSNPLIWATLIKTVAGGNVEALKQAIANGAARQGGSLPPGQGT